MKLLSQKQATDLQFIKNILEKKFDIRSITTIFSKAVGTYAFELNQDTIIKFPRKHSLEQLIQDNALLEFLQGKTEMKIPDSQIHDDEYVYTSYKKIIGEPITQDKLSLLPLDKQHKFCHDIAKFIFELHSLTHEVFNNIKIPYWDRFSGYPKPFEIMDKVQADDNFDTKEKEFIKNFFNNYSLANDDFIMCFSHFDIMPKNIAFDFGKQKIAGIYDFGDSGIGDVHHDFSQIGLHYSLETLKTIAAEYESLSGVHIDVQKALDYAFHSHAHFYMDKPTKKRAQLKKQIKLRL